MSNKQLLKDFEDFYKQKKYKEAKSLLIKNQDSFEQGVWYYNLALLDQHLGKPEYARLSLEKAISSGLESMKVHNLNAKIQKDLSLTYVEKPSSVQDNFYYYTEKLGMNSLLFISLVFLIFIIWKHKMIVGMWNKLILIFLSISPVLYCAYHDYTYESFVATDERVVRSGPSSLFEEEFSLPLGLKYSISKEFKEWGYIHYPQKFSGWVKMHIEEKI